MPTFERTMLSPNKLVATFQSRRYARPAQENGMIKRRINDIVWTDAAYRCFGARDAKLVVILAREAVPS